MTYEGTVCFVHEKGYFFIKKDGRQIFCHLRNWSEVDVPNKGDRVCFEIAKASNPKHGFEAVNVRPINAPEIGPGLDTLVAGGSNVPA